MGIAQKFLKTIVPKIYDSGLKDCNAAGLAMLEENKNAVCLDLGAGDGSLTVRFKERLTTRHIYGVEAVREYGLKAMGKDIKVIEFDLNRRWPIRDESLDIIISSQNIEHIYQVGLYLREAYRCLKPGGYMVIMTENLSSLVNIISLIAGWQPFSTTNVCGSSIGNPLIWHAKERKEMQLADFYMERMINLGGHVRVFAYKGLEELLKEAGFKKVIMTTAGYFPLFGWMSRLACKIDRRHGHFLLAKARKSSLSHQERT